MTSSFNKLLTPNEVQNILISEKIQLLENCIHIVENRKNKSTIVDYFKVDIKHLAIKLKELNQDDDVL